MANIFLSIPVLGRPELRMMNSLYQSCQTTKHKIRLNFNENDSLISRVRNVHMSNWYNDNKDCDYFMSWDSDIEASPTYGNIFDKLVAANKDFVGGLYALKKPGTRRSASIPLDGSPLRYNSGLIEMRWLSTGCWLITRDAVKKMIEHYPELQYEGDDNATGKKIYGLYIPMLYELKEEDLKHNPNVKLPFKKYLSEDWAFCERYRALGGKIYADTSIYLKHIGSTDYTLWDLKPKA